MKHRDKLLTVLSLLSLGTYVYVFNAIDDSVFMFILTVLMAVGFTVVFLTKFVIEWTPELYQIIIFHCAVLLTYILSFISIIIHNTNVITWLGGAEGYKLASFILWFFITLLFILFGYCDIVYFGKNKKTVTVIEKKEDLVPLLTNIKEQQPYSYIQPVDQGQQYSQNTYGINIDVGVDYDFIKRKELIESWSGANKK